MQPTNPDSPSDTLTVALTPVAGGVRLDSACGRIQVSSSHPHKADVGGRADFAAWYFLPLAMRLNKSLHVHGKGTRTTIQNAQKLSDIWQSWLPGHFYAVNVTFDETEHPEPSNQVSPAELCFYSGGLDAAHMVLKRMREGKKQDLLTVHGMDYALENEAQFEQLLEKTREFASAASDTRIIVRSDAYRLYQQYQVNHRQHHLAHIFSLAGAGFFHGLSYPRLMLAADDPLEVQYLTHPWGTNSATNRWFDSGITQLITDAEEVSRTEKISLLATSEQALASLTFCWNRKIQPDNCGECFKCLQTRLMFLASTGTVPAIFLSATLDESWPRKLHYKSPTGLSRVMEILITARRHGHTGAIPAFVETEQMVFRHYQNKYQDKGVDSASWWSRAKRRLRRE